MMISSSPFNIIIMSFTLLVLIFPTQTISDVRSEKQIESISSSSSNGEPYFNSTGPTNYTVQLGTHAFLPCTVSHLGNKSVSWIRKRDAHILTVDRYTFIADERFGILHNEEAWTLQIKFVQSRDEGTYECQVTTEPKMSLFIHLKVVVPKTNILGENDLYVKSGSIVQIKCIVTQCLEPPLFIFWYHDGTRVINSDGKHQWMERMNSDTMIATLVIKQADKKDSGNYTCAPSNLESSSISLHVINGEHPAAMQQGAANTKILSLFQNKPLLISLVLIFEFLK